MWSLWMLINSFLNAVTFFVLLESVLIQAIFWNRREINLKQRKKKKLDQVIDRAVSSNGFFFSFLHYPPVRRLQTQFMNTIIQKSPNESTKLTFVIWK